jgi:hypothetical protein
VRHRWYSPPHKHSAIAGLSADQRRAWLHQVNTGWVGAGGLAIFKAVTVSAIGVTPYLFRLLAAVLGTGIQATVVAIAVWALVIASGVVSWEAYRRAVLNRASSRLPLAPWNTCGHECRGLPPTAVCPECGTTRPPERLDAEWSLAVAENRRIAQERGIRTIEAAIHRRRYGD